MAERLVPPEHCPWGLKAQPVVDLQRFGLLHFEGRRLIQSWFARGYGRLDCTPEESFEPFIFCWISFNGWAACCSGEDEDWRWRDALAADSALARRFDEQDRDEKEFAAAVDDFRSLLPIFKAQQLRRRGIFLDGSSRREIVEFYLSQRPLISRAPRCFEDHVARGEGIIGDWPHVVGALYQVRCNLFHGEKAAHSEMDRLIVYSAFQVIARFLAPYIHV